MEHNYSRSASAIDTDLSTVLTPEEFQKATEPIEITDETSPNSVLFKINDLLHSGKDGKGLISVESLLTLYQLLTLAFSPHTEKKDQANSLKKIIDEKNTPVADMAWEDMTCDNDSDDHHSNNTASKTPKRKRKMRSEEDEEPRIENLKTTARRTRKREKKNQPSTTATTAAKQKKETTTPNTPVSPTPKTPAPPAEEKKNDKTPPIILHHKRDFITIERDLKLAGVKGFTATDQKDTIRLNTETSDIFRKAISYLDKRKIAFHCYLLQEEKTYKIVLKGIPEDYEEDEILALLKEEGHPVQKVQRMRKGPLRTPLRLMLLDVEKSDEGRKTFNIQRLGHINVSAETLRRKTELGQCHNCQMYGHSQSGCHAPARCVKCGKDHHTDSCAKNREDGPATCANCTGPHPANYKGCPKHPRAGKPTYRASDWPAPSWRVEQDSHRTPTQTTPKHYQTRPQNRTWAATVSNTTQLRPTTRHVSTALPPPPLPRVAARDQLLDELVRTLQESIATSQATLLRVCETIQATNAQHHYGSR